jgi:hypothetical protein
MPGFIAARYGIKDDAGTHAPNDFYFPPLVEDKLRHPRLKSGDTASRRIEKKETRPGLKAGFAGL